MAIPIEDIGIYIVQQIDQHMRIQIKYLVILKMFNGMDIIQSKYFLELQCPTYLNRIIQQHNWQELTPKQFPITYPADNTYAKQLDLAEPPIPERE